MLSSPGIPEDYYSLFKQGKLFLIGHRVFLLRCSSYFSMVDVSPQAFVFISLGLRGTTLSPGHPRNTLHLLCVLIDRSDK